MAEQDVMQVPPIGRVMLRPVSFRRTIAADVSRMGMTRRAAGAARATVAGPFIELSIASTPTTRPINMLPQSPRKMVAGGKLKHKKPRQRPP